MKADIHPKYFEAKVHCGSCGREWTVGSTRPELRVDVCGNCHPFYTGTQNIIDTAGQGGGFPKRPEGPGRGEKPHRPPWWGAGRGEDERGPDPRTCAGQT